MPSTRSQGNPLTPYDLKLRRTLRRMVGRGQNIEVLNDPIGVGQGGVA